jgi:uncharacterized protein (DUF1778 family)
MARSVHKKDRFLVRVTADQRRRLERAATIETQRRGELVGVATLLRELAMPRVDEIILAATTQPPVAA